MERVLQYSCCVVIVVRLSNPEACCNAFTWPDLQCRSCVDTKVLIMVYEQSLC